MIDSIFVARSGMLGHERGLNVISNNVANINTPGFRGSTVSFTDVFIGAAPNGPLGQPLGRGVDATRTQVSFLTGEAQSTGRDLDLLLNGDGFFVLEDENGERRFSRSGNFDFDDAGNLIVLGLGTKVMARDATGQLVPVSLRGLERSAAKATTKVVLDGILSAGDTDGEVIVDPITVFDVLGGKHTLKAVFNKEAPATGATTKWKMTLSEGQQEVGTATVEFLGGSLLPGTSPLKVTLTLSGAQPLEVDFNFDTVEGGNFGNNSNLTVQEQDGFAPGTIATRKFDEQGTLKITYTNGQTADGPRLALARISDQDSLVQLGNSLFAYRGTQPVDIREADDELQVLSGALERSNVSLTREFSELVLMQRGYQASSQVLSTANDMLQELLDMRGRR